MTGKKNPPYKGGIFHTSDFYTYACFAAIEQGDCLNKRCGHFQGTADFHCNPVVKYFYDFCDYSLKRLTTSQKACAKDQFCKAGFSTLFF
jgi:hypothetical protein